jgi:hypothetical protein
LVVPQDTRVIPSVCFDQVLRSQDRVEQRHGSLGNVVREILADMGMSSGVSTSHCFIAPPNATG